MMKPVVIIETLNHLLQHLLIFMFSPFTIHTVNHDDDTSIMPEYSLPSPLQVPLPHDAGQSSLTIKHRLPVTEYVNWLRLQRKEPRDQEEDCCAVCLDSVQPGHVVRQLGRCCHVFHAECIDIWIEKGHVSCPVCRAELLPDHVAAAGGCNCNCNVEDPWRKERMIYLFGADDFEF